MRTLFIILLLLYALLSFTSLRTFDPGGILRTGSQILLQPKRCGASDEGVILVHSHIANFELRASQRISKKLLGENNLRFVFILFNSSSVDESDIIEEQSVHGDILLCDREESYYNLVHKHIMGLLWAEQNCPDVEYVIKMDDDIFVDFAGLLTVVEKNRVNSSLWMMGMLQMKLPILRNRISKWAVSEEEFSGHFYPDFLSGWCYVSTPAAVSAILRMVDYEDMFWIDDVWVTGVLAGRVGVELVSLNMYYTVYREHMDCCTLDTSLLCPYLVGPSDGDSLVIEQAASHAGNCRTDKEGCKKRTNKEQSLLTTCKITNPLFLPSSGVIAEVIVI